MDTVILITGRGTRLLVARVKMPPEKDRHVFGCTVEILEIIVKGENAEAQVGNKVSAAYTSLHGLTV